MPLLLPSEERRSSDKEKDFNPKNAALRIRKKKKKWVLCGTASRWLGDLEGVT